MPIYEYRCKSCKKITSILARSTSSKFNVACEYCGGEKLEKLISGFSVIHGSNQTMDNQYEDFQRQQDAGELAGTDSSLEDDR